MDGFKAYRCKKTAAFFHCRLRGLVREVQSVKAKVVVARAIFKVTSVLPVFSALTFTKLSFRGIGCYSLVYPVPDKASLKPLG